MSKNELQIGCDYFMMKGYIYTIFIKGDNFRDFLFASLDVKSPSEMAILTGMNFLQEE